jgi:hypothetical protein
MQKLFVSKQDISRRARDLFAKCNMQRHLNLDWSWECSKAEALTMSWNTQISILHLMAKGKHLDLTYDPLCFPMKFDLIERYGRTCFFHMFRVRRWYRIFHFIDNPRVQAKKRNPQLSLLLLHLGSTISIYQILLGLASYPITTWHFICGSINNRLHYIPIPLLRAQRVVLPADLRYLGTWVLI